MRNLLITILLLLSAAAGAQTPVIEIEGGKVQGIDSHEPGVALFRGIPYAAPPVGELRWQLPQPVKPWQGVKVADTWSNIPPQRQQNPTSFYCKEFYWDDAWTRSEDCLYLNVWAPKSTIGKPEAKLPVVMWVHGGAYMSGYGFTRPMDGDAWAKRGVILVTINYRLGVLGFLPHEALSAESKHHVSGNYGLADQIKALQWVSENIAQFGGDPACITVMGQSAGGASIKNLVASPFSKPFIRRAIIQSAGGVGEFLSDGKKGERNYVKEGTEAMNKIGLTNLSAMRAASPEEVMKAPVWGIAAPHADGYLLPETFDEAVMDNTVADVEYLIGCTLDDITQQNKQIDAFCYARDSLSQKPVYQYLFARKLPGTDKAGAFHSAELWYMFNTLGRSWRPFTPADFDLSERMMDYWTNFAKYGNPNGPTQGSWHPFTLTESYVEVLNVKN